MIAKQRSASKDSRPHLLPRSTSVCNLVPQRKQRSLKRFQRCQGSRSKRSSKEESRSNSPEMSTTKSCRRKFVPAYLAITNNRALWSTAPDFERVITNLRFADVDTMGGAQYERGSKALRISYSPDDFPEAMRRYNPSGQLDATFLFPASEEADTMRMALLARGGFPGPHDEDEKARALARLRRQAATNVPEWKICPICCHQMKQRTEHAVRCASNRHLFSAPGTDPIIDESDERFGEIVREEPWVPILDGQRAFVGHPLAWVLRPPGAPGPPKLLDYESIHAAFVAS